MALETGTTRFPPVSPGIRQRLELIFDWYKGMVSDETGRLVYVYEPARELTVDEGSRIREIASVWDVELLSRFLDRIELRDLCERSLRQFRSFFVAHDGALLPESSRLGEPAGIAHSAFFLLATALSELSGREEDVRALANGLIRQQRPDGSYWTFFEGGEDEGLEFYPGEAMLSLMSAWEMLRDLRDLQSVVRGFRFLRDRLPAEAVAPDLRVFYANWQSQYAVLLHEHVPDPGIQREVAHHVFSLHDRVLADGFYDDLERHPSRQATVEVACALEGLNDAYTIAVRENDERRMRAWEPCIGTALAWLYRAQRLEFCTERERGGFGHSLSERTQRLDVTGHVMAGFIKTAVNGLAGG